MNWTTEADAQRIEREVDRVAQLCQQMLCAYTDWQWVTGDVWNTVYGDIIDFVNFRAETGQSCLSLMAQGQVADELGLCRTLLENYLLLTLMCRGTKFFQLVNLENKTPEEFSRILADEQRSWRELFNQGDTRCLDVRKYPRGKRVIMYVYEGLCPMSDDEPKQFQIPVHYFTFRDFRPETLRLRDEDYFEYYAADDELRVALKRHRSEAHFSYMHYLSYDALLVCLGLNEVVDEAARRRVEAHYTFLGKFVHPTHDAARDLRLRANVHGGRPNTGMDSPYSPAARLLLAVYVAHLLAGILTEATAWLESAPAEYIRDAATTDLRSAISSIEDSVNYFWSLFNGPTKYDKFEWAATHATDEQLAAHNGYANTPRDLIPFNQHIYGHFDASLIVWSNSRLGEYVPPVPYDL